MSRRYEALSTTGMGRYDAEAKWQPVTFMRCGFCGTVIAEDGFFSTFDALDAWPQDSFRARHAATCFGEDR